MMADKPLKTKADDPVLKALQIKIRDEMNSTSDSVIGGGASNYPQYTHFTGIIKGLAWAEEMLLTLDGQVTTED